MRRENEIVDPTGERQQQRRRTFVRFALPLLVVGSLIVAILGITLHSYQVNRKGVLRLSGQVLAGLQSTVTEEVVAYLDPAVRAATITNELLSHTEASARSVAFTGYAAAMLRAVPQIEAFYLANSNGEFAQVHRISGGGTETRLIRAGPNGLAATSDQRDAAGHVVNRVGRPDDNFDPRSTSWFKGAVAKAGGRFWSAPSLFRPTGKPVITVSVARRSDDKGEHVAAVDVALDDLSRFTSNLKVGAHGHAVIVDGEGHLIAAPELIKPGLDPSTTSLDAAGDPILTQAWNRERVLGFGARTATIANKSQVTIAAPLPGAAPGWVLLLAAPESDFAGFTVVGGRQSLLLSLVLVALASVLAALAVRQGVRADRTGDLLATTRDRSREERAALGTLVGEAHLFDPAAEAPSLTERLAALAGARRASIWRISRDGRMLACEDSASADGAHAGGFALSRAELPRFFEFLQAAEMVEIGDAGRDPRTAELYRLAMRESGSHSVALLPIPGEGGTAGIVMLEDPSAFARARNFAQAVAGIAAIRLRAARDAEPDADVDETPVELGGVAEDEEARSQAASLLPDGDSPEAGQSGVYPAASVMVLTFADPVVASKRDAGSAIDVADEVARAVQDAGRRFDIPYLKVVGHTLVAAAGCSADADGRAAAIRLADAALLIRELCLQAMERAELDAFFHVGLDVGRAVGRTLGQAPSVFNLWGDAVRMAELMAASAPDPGTIQVTEAAYLQLREHFLFRQRGRFYMPRVGVARCFVLAGRR